MHVEELDYDLPTELIAQRPSDRREAARLMVVHPDGRVEHHQVRDLPMLLGGDELLVFNDTRVIPARFDAVRQGTGGRVEGLYLESDSPGRWLVMLKARGSLQVGEQLLLDTAAVREQEPGEQRLNIVEALGGGAWLVELAGDVDDMALLESIGRMPLPPYIDRRGERAAELASLDRQRYQTVYARQPGAIAAPTAGLHFTPQLLDEITQQGVDIAWLTLHVGIGTFQPIRADELSQHRMHAERIQIPAATVDALRRVRDQHRPIIPIGTTSVRALESLPDPLPDLGSGQAHQANTELFIQPGFRFRFTDGLVTNFHLPRSTLLAMVGALVGLDRLKSLYRMAIENEYRFYSYGDAMLIMPQR
jgi:S-adenosylmethionine:tRNA ribosyltransferase-isomerase